MLRQECKRRALQPRQAPLFVAELNSTEMAQVGGGNEALDGSNGRNNFPVGIIRPSYSIDAWIDFMLLTAADHSRLMATIRARSHNCSIPRMDSTACL